MSKRDKLYLALQCIWMVLVTADLIYLNHKEAFTAIVQNLMRC